MRPVQSDMNELGYNKDEQHTCDNFYDRILPGNLGLALSTAAALKYKAEHWDEFRPVQLLAAGHTHRTALYSNARTQTQDDNIEKTADDDTENKYYEEDQAIRNHRG